MAEMERSTAVEVGYRLSGGVLIEQANGTKVIALADMPAFKAEGLLGDDDIAKLDALVADVHKGLQDRAAAASEARALTINQAAALRELKVTRRRLGHCVERALRGTAELVQYRQNSYHGSSVPSTCNDMNIKLAFLKKYQSPLAAVGVTAQLLAQVEADVRALEKTSGAQDAAISQLPDSTRAFCEAKGRLYHAIKDINSAGHALHAGDLEAAAKYNAKLLYQRRSKAKTEAANGAETKGG